MATLHDHLTKIIKELTQLQTVPIRDRNRNAPFPFPRMIGAGNGRSLVVSKEIDDTISVVAVQMLEADPSLAPQVTRAGWKKTVRDSFGPALTMLDLNEPADQNAKQVHEEIRARVTKHVEKFSEREHMSGYTLFGNSTVKRFAMGVPQSVGHPTSRLLVSSQIKHNCPTVCGTLEERII